MRSIGAITVAVVLGVCLAGCVTPATNTEPVANSVYATHKIVRDMQKDLAPRVTQLNETAADLSARVEENDVQVRALKSTIEENQVALEAMQARLDEIAEVLYRYLQVTPPSGPAAAQPGAIDVGPPEVVPPPDSYGDLSGVGPSGTATEGPGASSLSSNAVTDFNDALRSLDTQDYERALAQFDGFLQRYPNNDYTHRAQFWKAECLYRLKRYDEAVVEFEKLRANFPNSDKVPLSMHNQAAALISLGQRDKAIELLRLLVEKYPVSPAAVKAKSALENL
ncbi:MAG: tol-pal system protein YbgF [Candidatus Hydrogenedentes bacterium]|nr:tol-pal system protein YbgF [Candidatus Hydrogenedentota bacterium]